MGSMEYQPVSRKLILGRYITHGMIVVVLAIAVAVGALLWSSWLWLAMILLVAYVAWQAWLIPVQVGATGWREDEHELVITKGRMWHKLVTIPYSRIQYVDISHGPLAAKLGYAAVDVHTAAVVDSNIPGVPLAQAQQLRERFSKRLS